METYAETYIFLLFNDSLSLSLPDYLLFSCLCYLTASSTSSALSPITQPPRGRCRWQAGY